MKNKIAAIYCRTATIGKVQKVDMKKQIAWGVSRAKKDGYSTFVIIKDKGESGANLERTGLKRLIRLTKAEIIDTVYTRDSSRLSRNAYDYLWLKDLFEQHSVKLKTMLMQDNSEILLLLKKISNVGTRNQ